MKAILIDPYAIAVWPFGLSVKVPELVREIEIDKGIEAIYAALTHPEHEVTCFDVVRINNENDGIFVDDDGLYKHNDRFFLWKGYPQPLAGRGLILGCDEEGESIAPSVSLEAVRRSVRLGYMNFEVDPLTGDLKALPTHFAAHYADGEAA